METRFTSFARQHRLWQPDDRIGVAVSGGIDSMVLLHIFLKANIPVTVLHLNFQLRGEESDRDEAFVESFCQRHHLPFRVQRVNTKLYANEHGLSIQEAARAVRYAWFEKWLEAELTKIATAHHLNDAAETFFLNLLRGTGITGLSGIPVHQNGIVRPLLFASREEIENYAASHQIVWREDATNQTNDYRRNQIRHTVIPQLLTLNPGWLVNFASTQARLRAAADFLNQGVMEWKSDWQRNEAGDWRIPLARVFAFTAPAATLWEAVKEFGFSFAVCEQLVRALENPQPGKRYESATHQLWVDRGQLILSAKKTNAAGAVMLHELANTYNGPHGTMDVCPEQEPLAAHQFTAQLDSDCLTFPLVWRAWEPGDQFRPLGMTGFKKISDFLIDQKVPMSEKAHVSVVEAAGEIVWVVGFRIDDRFKVTEKTTQRITLKWSR